MGATEQRGTAIPGAGLFQTRLAPFIIRSRSLLELCYAPGCSVSLFFLYFWNCVKTGLQVTRAKLFHTVHNTVWNTQLLHDPEYCGISVDGEVWWWKSLKTMNLRGQKVPNLILTTLWCLLRTILRAILNPILNLFAWSRQQYWSWLSLAAFLLEERYLVWSYQQWRHQCQRQFWDTVTSADI